MHIKVDDKVRVISGEDKDVEAKVIEIDHSAGTVLVEGVAKVFKHVRRSQKNPQGGRLNKEAAIPLSKVMLVCPECGQAARTKVRILEDGTKERQCQKCEAGIGVLMPGSKRNRAAARKAAAAK